ncbi:MAG: hypothetical protein ACTHNU_08875 [Gaiellales bacterium]
MTVRPTSIRAAAAVACLALAAGCGSSGHGAAGHPGSHSKRTSSAAYYAKDKGNAQFAMGTSVLITAKGFLPHILLAPMGRPVVWKNSSSRTQSVHLDNYGSRVDSGPIKPGATWSFNPKAELSLVYHSTYDPHFRGQLQVQPIGNQ